MLRFDSLHFWQPPRVSLIQVCRSAGVEQLRSVKPFEMGSANQHLSDQEHVGSSSIHQPPGCLGYVTSYGSQVKWGWFLDMDLIYHQCFISKLYPNLLWVKLLEFPGLLAAESAIPHLLRCGRTNFAGIVWFKSFHMNKKHD